MVGFESTEYQVSEGDCFVEVCVTVVASNIDCPVNSSFTVLLSTDSVTAGIYLQLLIL